MMLPLDQQVTSVVHNVRSAGHIKPTMGSYPAHDVQQKTPRTWYMELNALQIIHLPSYWTWFDCHIIHLISGGNNFELGKKYTKT